MMENVSPAVLQRLSDADLEALSAGDLSKVSDQALQLLSASAGAPAAPKKPPMSASERFKYRAIDAPLDAGTQMAAQANRWLNEKTGGLVPRLQNDPSKAIAAKRKEYRERQPEGMDWAGLAGDVLSPVNLALMAIPGGTIPRAAALGAASGLLDPVEDDEDFVSAKAGQAALGAAGGAAANAAFRGMARVALPNASRNPDLALLRREGVRPTVGQALGGNTNRIEQRLTSVPVVGDAVRNLRNQATLDDFGVAALNRAGAPVGARATAPGQEGVGQIRDAITQTYDDAVNVAGHLRLDRTGMREIQQIHRMAAQLDPREQRAFRQAWNHIATDISPNGSILPQNFKRIDSYLGQQAANFRSGTDPYARQLGDALGELQRSIRDSAMRSNPAGQALNRRADRAHAQMVRIEAAANKASSGGTADGRFTPAQLGQAVRSSDRTARHRANARGDALLQDLSGAGQRVLGNTVPDSGSAERVFTGALFGGAAIIEPTTLALIATGRIAYTPQVQRALVAMVANRSPGWEAAARILRQFAAHSAPAAASLLED